MSRATNRQHNLQIIVSAAQSVASAWRRFMEAGVRSKAPLATGGEPQLAADAVVVTTKQLERALNPALLSLSDPARRTMKHITDSKSGPEMTSAILNLMDAHEDLVKHMGWGELIHSVTDPADWWHSSRGIGQTDINEARHRLEVASSQVKSFSDEAQAETCVTGEDKAPDERSTRKPRESKWHDLHLLHDEMKAENPDVSDKEIVKAYRKKYSRREKPHNKVLSNYRYRRKNL